MSEKHEQTIITGLLTEDDVFRSVMRKHGRKGGSTNSEAQRQARSKNLKKARAVMKEIRKSR